MSGVPAAVSEFARTFGGSVGETIRLEPGNRARDLADETTATALPTLRVGREGEVDLRVIELLGTGGMGQVRLAQQRALGRDVALKSVLPHAQANGAAQEQLVREAMITGRLEHPNIVPVHLLGVDERGDPLLVMKRVEGLPWSELDVAERALTHGVAPDREPLLRHLEIFLEVCRAVGFAHARGVVHRDIKPSNVMIGPFGEVYLLDWGIATPLNTPAYAHATSDDGSALPLGTPVFMAPEMIHQSGVIDARTDVFLLGATLHRVLTGRPRHVGDDAFEVLQVAAYCEPYAYGDEVPAELAAICNRATEASPDDRYQSVIDLREAVMNYLRHRTSIELAEEAEGILDAIERLDGSREGDRAEQNRLFTECRFAFVRALREWRDNARASRGLARCLTRMIRRDLAAGAWESAKTLLDDMPEPDEALAAEIEAARTAAAEERDRVAALKNLAFEADMRVGWLARAALLGVISVLALSTLVAFSNASVPRSPAAGLVVMAFFYVTFGGAVAVFRRRVLANEASRKLMALVFVASLGMTINRGVAHFTGGAFVTMLAVDGLVTGLIAACCVAAVDRALWIAAVLWLASAIVIPFVGDVDGALVVFSVSQLLGHGSIVVAWVRRNRAA